VLLPLLKEAGTCLGVAHACCVLPLPQLMPWMLLLLVVPLLLLLVVVVVRPALNAV
jgi:hypothetical protein